MMSFLRQLLKKARAPTYTGSNGAPEYDQAQNQLERELK
jgi:hypothetical protein